MTRHCDDDLWNTGRAARLDAVRSSLPQVVTSGETIFLEGRPRFKSPQRMPCPNCGAELRRGRTTWVFKHAPEGRREQCVDGWICDCGEAYVPGDIAKRAFRRAMQSNRVGQSELSLAESTIETD